MAPGGVRAIREHVEAAGIEASKGRLMPCPGGFHRPEVPAVAALRPLPARASPAGPLRARSRSPSGFVPLAPSPLFSKGALRAWSAALDRRCRAGFF